MNLNELITVKEFLERNKIVIEELQDGKWVEIDETKGGKPLRVSVFIEPKK